MNQRKHGILAEYLKRLLDVSLSIIVIVASFLANQAAAETSVDGIASAASKPKGGFEREVFKVHRLDTSPFNVITYRPKSDKPLPLLVLVDGGDCVSVTSARKLPMFSPPTGVETPVALLMVEKSGVGIGRDDKGNCSETFYKYNTIDQRVEDHQRTFQYLRHNVKWWNGDIYINGHSDGGAVAIQLAAYNTNVKRAAFGSVGGGYSLAESIGQFTLCDADKVADAPKCEKQLEKTFDAMRENPSPNKQWDWDTSDGSYKSWAGRLDDTQAVLLREMQIPILLYQGYDDERIMRESARKAKEYLIHSKVNFSYWEIPEMGHEFESMEEARRMVVWQSINRWVMGEKPGAGGPKNWYMWDKANKK